MLPYTQVVGGWLNVFIRKETPLNPYTYLSVRTYIVLTYRYIKNKLQNSFGKPIHSQQNTQSEVLFFRGREQIAWD